MRVSLELKYRWSKSVAGRSGLAEEGAIEQLVEVTRESAPHFDVELILSAVMGIGDMTGCR